MRDLRSPGALRAMVAGLLVGTALLTACSDATEANDTLPSTSSAPTTEALPEMGPADFPVPDEARTKDAAGAEAFLRYWIDLFNRQQAIPAGQPIRDLGPECQECSRIARVFDETAAAGYKYEGGELSLSSVAEAELEGDRTLINFLAQQTAIRRVDAAGQPVDAGMPAAPRLSSGMRLVYSDEDECWFVEAVQLG